MTTTTTRTAARPRRCAECGTQPPNNRLYRLRCAPCYRRHHYQGKHIDLPRVTRPREDLTDDYLLLRSEGFSRAQIATRLGITRNTLDQALKRAALAGDTRIDYKPRQATA